MFATEFVYDGISSKEYDLIICSFDGGQNGSFTAGSKIEFTTFKAPNSNKWVKTASTYSEQLTFTYQICKNQCTSDAVFSEREIAFLMRWLVRKDYKVLQFIQEGYENIYFNAQINAEKYLVAGECVGFTLTILCDAPWGWSETKSATLNSSDPYIELYDDSDEIGEIMPTLEILVNSDCDIAIKNEMTDKNFVIKGCKSGEIIECNEMSILSTKCVPETTYFGYSGEHETLFDDFNWQWFTIGNNFHDRVNKITLEGDCEVTMTWKVPRKAVI